MSFPVLSLQASLGQATHPFPNKPASLTRPFPCPCCEAHDKANRSLHTRQAFPSLYLFFLCHSNHSSPLANTQNPLGHKTEGQEANSIEKEGAMWPSGRALTAGREDCNRGRASFPSLSCSVVGQQFSSPRSLDEMCQPRDAAGPAKVKREDINNDNFHCPAVTRS